MAIVTVTNQKGGVGKTTSTLNLGAALQRRGWRVLVVDFDPQGNLSTCCGFDEMEGSEGMPTLADALLTTVRGPTVRKVRLPDVIVASPSGLDLIPADKHLAAAEAALYSVYGREYALRDTLEMVKDQYDVILVDSVPTLGLLAINALAAAQGVIIPVQAEFLAVHGLAQLLESVSVVHERLNPDLSVWGVLMTMVDPRTKHSREVSSAVRASLPEDVVVFDSQIPVSVKLKESAKAARSIFVVDPGGKAAQSYAEFAVEVEPYLGSRGSAMTAAGVRGLLDDFRRQDSGGPEASGGNGTARVARSGSGEVDGAARTDAHRPEGGRGIDRIVALQGTSETKAASGNGAPSDEADSRPTEPSAARAGMTISPRAILASSGADGALIGSGKRPAFVCPKLGLETNPKEHLPMVSHEHRCYADEAPLEISNYAQRLYCLTDRYGTCGRYLRAQMKTQAPSPEQSSSFLAKVRSALNRSAS